MKINFNYPFRENNLIAPQKNLLIHKPPNGRRILSLGNSQVRTQDAAYLGRVDGNKSSAAPWWHLLPFTDSLLQLRKPALKLHFYPSSRGSLPGESRAQGEEVLPVCDHLHMMPTFSAQLCALIHLTINPFCKSSDTIRA